MGESENRLSVTRDFAKSALNKCCRRAGGSDESYILVYKAAGGNRWLNW